MGLSAWVFEPLTFRVASSISAAVCILLLVRSLYRTFLHPLAKVPGPLVAKCTSLWIYYHSYVGDECTTVHKLHLKYGPVIRVGPNDVDIADGRSINTIYMEKGGFLKAACYENFHIDGHQSIFSALDPMYRAPRAKAVVSMFSTASLRGGSEILYGCMDRLVDRMKIESKTGKRVNVLNLARSLATDAVTAYLFHDSYGGLEEKEAVLSASAFVDAFVAVGRFFYLPNAVFLFLEWTITTFLPDKHTETSMTKVDDYVSKLVDSSEKSKNYPGRLLQAGFSKSEARAQCKDLIFAGTDSTGMNLATICWHLSQHPEMYAKLKEEVDANKKARADIQGLPYLRGVIREGLRLSMANPTRLPRVVPRGGWSYGEYHFAAGVVIGVAPYELHLDPLVFPNPQQFTPDRWLNPSEEMQRDWIPFGMGSRACIARNLATLELFMAVEKLVESDALAGSRAVGKKIEIVEWFNSKVKDEKIELEWS